MAVVWIPSLLQKFTHGIEQIPVSGSNLRQVISSLVAVYPDLHNRLLDERGRIQPNIAVAIDGETNHLGLIEPVAEEAEIHFIPAIGGG